MTIVAGEKRVIGRAAPLLFLLCFLPWVAVDPGSSVIFWDTVAVRWLGGLTAVPDLWYWGGIVVLSLLPPVGWFVLKKRWREFGMGATVWTLAILTLWNVVVNFVGVQWGIQRASPGVVLSREVLAGIFIFVLVVSIGCEELWQMSLFEMVGKAKPASSEGTAKKRRGFSPPRRKRGRASQ